MEAQILAALEASAKEFHGDPRRVYLTGFSMGGYGTWSLAAKYPNRFAAIVVVCGGIQWPTPHRITNEEPYRAIAGKVAGIPIWVFHGNADRNVFVTESREMVKLLRALQADVRYTEYDVRRVVGMIKRNEYKRRQSPIGIRVTQRGFGKDWRYPITSAWTDWNDVAAPPGGAAG